MRMNKLALTMMLLTGAIGVSAAMAAETSTSDVAGNSVVNTRPEPAASAVSPPGKAVQTPGSPEASAAATSATSDSSSPAAATQQSDTAATAVPSGSAPVLPPAPQEAATPEAVQKTSAGDHPSSAVNPPDGVPSGSEKNAPHPPATGLDPTTVTNGDATQNHTQTSSTTAAPLFTPEQEARIGEVAKAYLLKHPELLIEVDEKLQKIQYEEQTRAMTTAAIQHQDALLNDKTVPAIGPADASVAFIEFFDYQCSVCARQAPVIQSLMKNNPQVRFVFKEWPIFGYRWKPSFEAAETGLRIWQQKGGDAYMNYHNMLFASEHVEGALTHKDVTRAASAAGAGKLKVKNNDMLETLSRTDILAKNLGFQGTPGIIVIPVKGATSDNVTVIPGGAPEPMLQDAINKASNQPGN